MADQDNQRTGLAVRGEPGVLEIPLDPNGSRLGMTALITTTECVTIMMPRPGRVHPTVAMSGHSVDWPEESPWMQLVRNVRAWVG